MATIHKLTKDGATIFPATITDAVVHPQTGKTLTSMMKDYNVSELFPTEGIDGGNKYNLALAIQVLGTHLSAAQKTGGIKLTFISSVSPYPEEEYYLSKSSWSTTASDWDQRFEVGDVIADPSGSWTPSTAEAYIDQQVATVTGNLASETIARQTSDANLSTQLSSEMATRSSQDANLLALINAGLRDGGDYQFDSVPTQNSANLMTSGAIYNTIKDSNLGFIDDTPTYNSNNFVKSGGILSYTNRTKGIFSWQTRYKEPIATSIKTIELYCKESLVNDKIILNGFYILSQYNNLYAEVWNLTKNAKMGTYAISSSSVGGFSGLKSFTMGLASSNTLDETSKLEVTMNFDEFTVTDWNQANIKNENFPIFLPKINKSPKNIDCKDLISKSFLGIEGIRMYVPDDEINAGYTLSGVFGFWTSQNCFYLRLFNGDSGYAYAQIPMANIPSSGKSTLSMILDYSASYKFYYAEIDIDWSEYANATKNTNFTDKFPIKLFGLSQLDSLKGDLYLNTNQSWLNIPEGIHLKGENCTITINNIAAGLILRSNSSLEGIKFIDGTAGAITREEYTAEEIAEKPSLGELFRPMCDLEDLNGQSAELIYGHATNKVPAVYIANNATNAGVKSCIFEGFNRPAIIDGDYTDRHKNTYHGYIVDCMFINCRTGIFSGAEFCRIIGNYFYGCILSWVINTSNTNAVNNIFVRDDVGLYFTNQNNAHGEISTHEIVHIGVAGLYAKQINNEVGFIISNSQFVQAPIIAETAYALKFSSCRLDTYFIIQQGAKNSIIGNNMRKASADSDGITNIFDVPEDTLITLNRAVTSLENDSIYNRA